jgi:cell division septation protein DedD
VRVLPGAPSGRDRTQLYRVQVGAFSARSNAQDAFNRLLNAGYSPVCEVQGGLTRVQIPWVRGDELQVIGPRLYSIGFREVLIRSER